MAESLNNIIKRTHKLENREKYSKLILHTSDITDGEQFIKGTEYASEMLEKAHADENCALEYQKTVRKLAEWLDRHGWA